MAFSSQDVASWSPAQCALPPIVVAAAAAHLSAAQPPFWQRMCGTLFCPYRRRGSFPSASARAGAAGHVSAFHAVTSSRPPAHSHLAPAFRMNRKGPIVQLRGRPSAPTSIDLREWPNGSIGSIGCSRPALLDLVLIMCSRRSQLCQQGARWEENICHI